MSWCQCECEEPKVWQQLFGDQVIFELAYQALQETCSYFFCVFEDPASKDIEFHFVNDKDNLEGVLSKD